MFNENVSVRFKLKIFTALLDNKIVEKILTNDIELPYFD